MHYDILKILGTFSNTLTNMPVMFDAVWLCWFVIGFFARFFGGGGGGGGANQNWVRLYRTGRN
jgi:hypothetical protein